MIDAAGKLKGLAKLSLIKPITSWDEIEEGELYHIPPIFFSKRQDFFVIEKHERYMRVFFSGENFTSSIYKADTVSNFIVKKWSINER